MKSKYKAIWEQVKPLIVKAKRKNFILHTQMVIKAMEEIISGEGGDPNILIPAAILHDVGWPEVSEKLQLANDRERFVSNGLTTLHSIPTAVSVKCKVC